MNATIPFCGFYESTADYEIDRALESLVSDSNGDAIDSLLERLHDHVNYSQVFQGYAKLYVGNFATEAGIDCKFLELDSPREYNFTTDRILVTLSRDEARRLRKATTAATLDTVAAERHTSCSGFVSFYSPDWRTWGSVGTWDLNQLGTLVIAYCRDNAEEALDHDVVMQDANGNGCLDDIVWTALGAEGGRIANVAAYLRNREDRRFYSRAA